MDNVSKAMQMVGGVLIGVILLALVSYFFSSIGAWPAEEDDIESAEQTAAFNLEYEVYDKKGMYGVDVISCLNKAKSNNEKYVEGGSFLTGTKYGEEYTIDVYVHLNDNTLDESIEVYYYDSGKRRQDLNGEHPNSALTMNNAGFDVKSTYLTSFTSGTDTRNVNTRNTSISIGSGDITYNSVEYFSLLNGEVLSKLLNMELSYTVTNTGGDLTDWSNIVWTTALSDFKSKKFKCDYMGYNTDTGRVNEIYFSEI